MVSLEVCAHVEPSKSEAFFNILLTEPAHAYFVELNFDKQEIPAFVEKF